MDILFRIRGGLDFAFQLATTNGESVEIQNAVLHYTIKNLPVQKFKILILLYEQKLF